MKATWALRCKHCQLRAEPDAVLEAYLLHMQVEHATDEVAFDLVAVCECGTEMEYLRTAQIGNTGERYDSFMCPADGRTWNAVRGRSS